MRVLSETGIDYNEVEVEVVVVVRRSRADARVENSLSVITEVT